MKSAIIIGACAPIWAVIALTLDGQTMNMAQMLQFSQTIKRGSGKATQAH